MDGENQCLWSYITSGFLHSIMNSLVLRSAINAFVEFIVREAKQEVNYFRLLRHK